GLQEPAGRRSGRIRDRPGPKGTASRQREQGIVRILLPTNVTRGCGAEEYLLMAFRLSASFLCDARLFKLSLWTTSPSPGFSTKLRTCLKLTVGTLSVSALTGTPRRRSRPCRSRFQN